MHKLREQDHEMTTDLKSLNLPTSFQNNSMNTTMF